MPEINLDLRHNLFNVLPLHTQNICILCHSFLFKILFYRNSIFNAIIIKLLDVCFVVCLYRYSISLNLTQFSPCLVQMLKHKNKMISKDT